MKKIVFLSTWLVALAAFGGFSLGNLGNIDVSKVVKSTTEVAHGVKGIGLEEEKTIGNSVAVEIVSRYGGLVRDEAITRRINLIGKSIARYCDRPELTYRFGVLNSATVNAFSAPGGDVFITKGLYDLIQNDDQLAGVLAHEITHVSERHALRIIEKGEKLEGLTGLAEAGGTAFKKADITKFAPIVGKGTKIICEKGFDPGTEYEADLGGARLAVTVGYAPDGLEEALKTLQQHETGKTPFFPTHPPLKKRIAKLDDFQTAKR
jgi:predicted Zn-dependent protease